MDLISLFLSSRKIKKLNPQQKFMILQYAISCPVIISHEWIEHAWFYKQYFQRPLQILKHL